MSEVVRIAGLPGDGIGPEVFPFVEQLIDRVNSLNGDVLFDVERFPYNGEWYLQNGQKPWPDSFVEQELMPKFRAMFLIALGDPRLPKNGMAHAETIILDTGRTKFDTNFNKRPTFVVHPDLIPVIPREKFDIKLFHFDQTQVQSGEEIKGLVGSASEVVSPHDIYSARNFESLLRSAVSHAIAGNQSKILVAHKANVFDYAHGAWAEISKKVSAETGIKIELQLMDSFLERLVRSPQTVPGIIVTDHAFGSVLKAPLAALAKENNRGNIPADFDIIVGRENIEGMYYRGGNHLIKAEDRIGIQIGKHSRLAIEANINECINLAKQRGWDKTLTVLHLNDIHPLSYGLWKRVAEELCEKRGFSCTMMHAGEFVATAISDPAALNHRVFAACNLIGDLVADAAAGLVGGMGIPPTNSYNTTGTTNKRFLEPVHGSAPDIAGQGRADPTATFLTIGELFESYGYPQYYIAIRKALFDVIESGTRTRDMPGGTATTEQFGNAVMYRFMEIVDSAGSLREQVAV